MLRINPQNEAHDIFLLFFNLRLPGILLLIIFIMKYFKTEEKSKTNVHEASIQT